MKKSFYRLLDSAGNVEWQGHAYSVEHAEEKAFWDESPGSLERYSLEVWGKVRLSKSQKAEGWVSVYRNQCLSPV